MPKYPPNRLPLSVPKRHFELRRGGLKGAAAARRVGVSTSAGSVWFIKAGRMLLPDKPIDDRYLTQDDRITIAEGLLAGRTPAVIAEEVGKHRSTVYREISRVRGPRWPVQPVVVAQPGHPPPTPPQAKETAGQSRAADIRQRQAEAAVVTTADHPGPRPEPPGRAGDEPLPRDRLPGPVQRAARQTCRPPADPQDPAEEATPGHTLQERHPNMRPVHTRPREAEERRQAGHWEGDLILGRAQSSAIGTLVDRATRYTRLIHLPDGWKAPQLRDALTFQTADLPARLRRTLTWDQGRELYLHEEIEDLTGFQIYFCDPHSPWRRGTNENTNGLLREYFPKGTDLARHTLRDLAQVERQLNQRPRRILGDRTPAEAMRRWSRERAYC
jgi:IS30 family transposase